MNVSLQNYDTESGRRIKYERTKNKTEEYQGSDDRRFYREGIFELTIK